MWQTWIAGAHEVIPWQWAMLVAGGTFLGAIVPWLPWKRLRLRSDPTPATDKPTKEEGREEDAGENAKSDLLKMRITFFQRQAEAKTRELKDTSEDLAKCREGYKRLQHESGRWHISRCGTDEEIRNLSVAVQFVALDDRHLAKQITELFSISWRVKKPDQILLSGDDLRDNPCPDSRIVLFSNEERAGHLCCLMREFDLLNGEKIYDKPKQSDMEDDVTIIIFPEKGSVF